MTAVYSVDTQSQISDVYTGISDVCIVDTQSQIVDVCTL